MAKKRIRAISLLIALSLFMPLFAIQSTAADVNCTVNYADEYLYFGNSFSGTPIYMYSPNAEENATVKKQQAEKWYPVYGDSVDISSYIPKDSAKKYFIAVRLADDKPNMDGVYASRSVIRIENRVAATKNDMKNYFTYDPKTETLVVNKAIKAKGFDYKVNNCNWVYAAKEDVDLNSDYNALGGTITVRISANSAENTFSSLEYKVKIPAAPAAPSLKVNERTAKISNIQTAQAWSTTENGEFTTFVDKVIEIPKLEDKTTDLENFSTEIVPDTTASTGTEQYYIMYVKKEATEKKPSSPLQKLYIKKSLTKAS